MWDTVANVFLNIYSRWADRPVVRVKVKRLEYNLVRNDPHSELVLITPYPSRYYAEVEFSHRGKATTIRSLTLVLDNKLQLEAASFNPLKFEHGDFQQQTISFPVDEDLAIKEGAFELIALDAFGKEYKDNGRFPVLPNE